MVDNVTAPVNELLVLPNVMVLPPAEKLDAPETVIASAGAPACVIAPVLLIVKLPTDSEMPAILNATALVNDTSPLEVFVALNEETMFVLLKVVPPTDDVFNDAPMIMADAPSVIVPLALFNVTILLVVLMPFTVLISSVSESTMMAEEPRTEISPVTSAAILLRTLVCVEKLTPAERKIRPALSVDKSSTPSCVMVLPESKVNTPE